MTKNKEEEKIELPLFKTRKEVREEALKIIELERSGKQLFLKTRYNFLNAALGKGFRFGQVYLLAGLSGHGKSTLLNIFCNDFLNKDLNKDVYYDYFIPYFAFEMMPENEEIRVLSSKTGKSFLSILSSEINKETGEYDKLCDEEFEVIKQLLKEDDDFKLYYYSNPMTIKSLLIQIRYAHRDYFLKLKETKPNIEAKDIRFVAMIDHTLLVEADKGDSVLDLIANLGKMAIKLKKAGNCIVFLGQLNNEIENENRILKPLLHYPRKSDIYAQAQLFNACDCVMIIHCPEMLGIIYYSMEELYTKGLLHLLILKQRFGTIGSIFLKKEFEKGRIIPYLKKEIPIKKDIKN